jgi:chromosome segregation ATPase
MDESPLNVMRSELAQKNIEIAELQNKAKIANEAREDFRKKYEQIRRDMIELKKKIDKEKSETLTKQSEELDTLKKTLINRQA